MATFFGFSTIDKNHKSNSLTDIELMKRDLLNHFHTRRGERVMYPYFGSIIWDMLFEPFTEANRDLIVEDVIRVVNSETRVNLNNVDVEELDHGIRIQMNVTYIPNKISETFSIDFDKRTIERV